MLWCRMKNGKLRLAGKIVYIPLDLLCSFPLRPRVYFNVDADDELLDSIAELGIIEPLTVCYAPRDTYYVISGERRLRAASALGMEEAPCVIVDISEQQAALYRISDDFQHEELNYFEKAEYIERIASVFDMDYSSLSLRTGVPLQEIRSLTRLLAIPTALRIRMIDNGLTERFARLLLHHSDDAEKKTLLNEIVCDRLTLSQAKERSAEILKGRRKPQKILTFFRDLTIFVNTIDHAVETMRESGIAAQSDRSESEDAIEYRIVIPKSYSGSKNASS